MDQEYLCHLGFSHCLAIGPVRFQFLYKHFGSAHKAYYAEEHVLIELIGERVAKRFTLFRKANNLVQISHLIRQKGITVYFVNDKMYPSYLKQIPDPPICLYVKGNVKNIDFERDTFFGIVGTRKPSSYGEFVTRKFASELSAQNIIIISGMAMGIDAIAHWQTIQSGTKTIAVLGSGVEIIYPASNTSLYYAILKAGGLIVSELPPLQYARKEYFILRNRIVSALSRGVLVVEGTKDSGSLITARYAASFGKEVFAPPVPITSCLTEAPSILVQQGAKLVTGTDDILSELHLAKAKRSDKPLNLTLNETNIIKLIGKEEKTIDELVQETGDSISILSFILSSLEIKGIIGKNREEKYYVVLW